jgi:hypothetical protein
MTMRVRRWTRTCTSSEVKVYGVPPDPVVATRELPRMWRHAGVAVARLVLAALAPCARSTA